MPPFYRRFYFKMNCHLCWNVILPYLSYMFPGIFARAQSSCKGKIICTYLCKFAMTISYPNIIWIFIYLMCVHVLMIDSKNQQKEYFLLFTMMVLAAEMNRRRRWQNIPWKPASSSSFDSCIRFHWFQKICVISNLCK